jgi:hypothetical protein
MVSGVRSKMYGDPIHTHLSGRCKKKNSRRPTNRRLTPVPCPVCDGHRAIVLALLSFSMGHTPLAAEINPGQWLPFFLLVL